MTNAKLNELIHERDRNTCCLCGRYVDPGVKWHHVIFRSHGGKDTAQNGVTLCMDCHSIAHGEFAKDARAKLQEYLRRINEHT